MSIFINQIINLVILYPKFMESSLLKKIMYIFPDKIANRYDKTIGGRQDYDAPFLEGLRHLDFNYDFDGKVLDLCTGTGFAAITMAELFPKATITGIDQSQAMVDIAKEKAKSKKLNNVEFLNNDASNLSFNDRVFDLIMVSNAPFYFEEVIKVMKPSGFFLISLSFGGNGIIRNKKRIKEYLQLYNLKVVEMQEVKKGAIILSKLDIQ